jgi:hypothetical protein
MKQSLEGKPSGSISGTPGELLEKIINIENLL